MHRVTVDRAHKLMEMRIVGPADAATIGLAGAAARQAIKSLGTPPGGHASLYDLSAMELASQDAIERAFREWSDPRFSCVRAKKVALIVPSALARLRLDRLRGSAANLNIFDTRAAAMKWLFA